jgi:hypothetical protein
MNFIEILYNKIKPRFWFRLDLYCSIINGNESNKIQEVFFSDKNFFFIFLKYQWLAHSKGKASSIVLFGFGLGGFFFPELVSNYINPDNIEPDKPYSDEFPSEK